MLGLISRLFFLWQSSLLYLLTVQVDGQLPRGDLCLVVCVVWPERINARDGAPVLSTKVRILDVKIEIIE